MSGVAPDPLDALEHRARNIKTFTELPIGVFRDYGFRSKDEGLRKLALDVLALVEVARAARALLESRLWQSDDGSESWQKANNLAAALARLDKDTT